MNLTEITNNSKIKSPANNLINIHKISSMKKNFFLVFLFFQVVFAGPGDAGKLVDQAKALLDQAKYQEAEKIIIQALEASDKEKDNYNLVRSTKLLGTLYYNYRELAAAESFFELADSLVSAFFPGKLTPEIEEELYNIRNNLAITLMESARKSSVSGNLQKAEDIFTDVLDYYKEQNNDAGIAAVLSNLGILYRLDAVSDPEGDNFAGTLRDALDVLEKAEDYADRTGDKNQLSNIWSNRGITYQLLGMLDSAAYFLKKSITEFGETGNEYWASITSLRLGYLYIETAAVNEKDSALRGEGIKLLRENILKLEDFRSKLGDERGRALFLDDLTNYYVLLINELFKDKDTEGMFNLAEMVKSRSFIDMLSTKASGLEENIPENLKTLLAEKKEIETIFRDSLWVFAYTQNFERFISLVNEYSKIYQEQEELQPNLQTLVSEETIKLHDFQKLLDDSTAVVEFFVGNSAVYSFLITNKSAEVFRAKDTPQRIDSLVTKILADIEEFSNKRERFVSLEAINHRFDDLDSADYARMWFNSNADRALQYQLFNLYQNIIGNAANKTLRDYRRVIVIPHGFLHSMPFAALVSDFGNLDNTNSRHIARPKYWIEEKEILTIPSASSLPFLLKSGRDDDGTIMIIGNPVYPTKDPTLPFAEKEAKSIAKHFDPEKTLLLIGQDATETKIKKEAKNFDIIHFATHGVYKDDALQSYILSTKTDTDDGFLRASEIFKMKLNSNLVVLSACLSGKIGSFGKTEHIFTTDDLTGLTRALLYAGSANVLGTLWSVSDQSTGYMMEKFYHAYRDEKKSILQSMREAQLAVMNYPINSDWSHPFYWAPFILIGSPR
ncbi:MAG: CHAT domain-containing protein [Ignavibacteriaceae bacterium]|nr:MAG: CHAT domain-containing protein [Ignavibacteriaceae bacterium]MBV6445882.1 hypothetical protein [Ignavibacteriaceae bacterium]